MPNAPEPLTLPADADDTAVRRLVTAHFGPGHTILGITAPGPHPGIHRATLAAPPMPSCGLISNGWKLRIEQVIAVSNRAASDADSMMSLLHEIGIEPCRMCRRCWKNSDIPPHQRASCYPARRRRPARHRR